MKCDKRQNLELSDGRRVTLSHKRMKGKRNCKEVKFLEVVFSDARRMSAEFNTVYDSILYGTRLLAAPTLQVVFRN
jgi:hypothetical protein